MCFESLLAPPEVLPLSCLARVKNLLGILGLALQTSDSYTVDIGQQCAQGMHPQIDIGSTVDEIDACRRALHHLHIVQ